MADDSRDPFALWRKMFGEMEKGFNAFANQAMSSPQFSKTMNQASGATVGAQRQLGHLMERYLLAMNMPSRAQMVDMAERLQSIEGHLNDIKTLLQQMSADAAAPPTVIPAPTPDVLKPPRTKRPPAEPKQAEPTRSGAAAKQPSGEDK
jgi:hypothetical protein